jgi:hypothetical protein
VISESGERWVIGWDVIEFPRNYRFPDSRRENTEWHPRVRALIQRNLEINQADYREHCQEQHRLAAVNSLQWQLERSLKPHPMAGKKVPNRAV